VLIERETKRRNKMTLLKDASFEMMLEKMKETKEKK
jgi:hypothetical protein